MKWYFQVLKKYATFTGRARRTEFWMYLLWSNLFAVLIFLLPHRFFMSETAFHVGWIVVVINLIAEIVPLFAVMVRRMQDAGLSGRLVYLNFIPILGPIAFLVLACLPGTEGSNNYGPDPKMPEDDPRRKISARHPRQGQAASRPRRNSEDINA